MPAPKPAWNTSRIFERLDERRGEGKVWVVMLGKIALFYEVCPEFLEMPGEMLTVMVANHPRVPDDEYGFLEAYCADPKCDCRVAYLTVVGKSRPGKVLAQITFGWEPLDFYVKWMGAKEADAMICDLKGPALMHMAPQSKLAPALLELLAPKLQEDLYVQQIKRHYFKFKAVLCQPGGRRK